MLLMIDNRYHCLWLSDCVFKWLEIITFYLIRLLVLSMLVC